MLDALKAYRLLRITIAYKAKSKSETDIFAVSEKVSSVKSNSDIITEIERNWNNKILAKMDEQIQELDNLRPGLEIPDRAEISKRIDEEIKIISEDRNEVYINGVTVISIIDLEA